MSLQIAELPDLQDQELPEEEPLPPPHSLQTPLVLKPSSSQFSLPLEGPTFFIVQCMLSNLFSPLRLLKALC